ncbi:MAG: efflux RND transporter permease subunit [Verrucomicrobiales bacterium]
MQGLSTTCIKRPVFASMLILALVVVGAASYMQLGVDRLPSVDMPTVRVSTALPGASPPEIEVQVSEPLEQAINTVQGINELRSISGPGQSIIIVTFNLDRNIDNAAQDVRERVAAAIRELPLEADPPIITKFDNDLSPIMTLSFSGQRSLRELTELADKQIKTQLERAPGVGGVEIVGGRERSINVWVDANRLAAYEISMADVQDALQRQNSNIPGGNVTSDLQEKSLRTLGRLTDAASFNELVVATINGSPVKIKDIGYAEDGTKEQRSMARLNGEPTVTMQIRRQSDANTVMVIEEIKDRVEKLRGTLPPDVQINILQDQSRYIYNALHEITLHLVLGSILASLIVLMFMRNWRATIIAAVAIPASVIATFGMMRAMDFTLNSVTMLALVLMVGVVIDDAIVVLENIFRYVEEKKMHPFKAAQAATSEIALAVMATTLSLVVIFVPVSFMSSISGRFLFQFGITAAVAVMVSLLVSFTLTPMMSARLFKPVAHDNNHGGKGSRGGLYGQLEAKYLWLLRKALAHRGIAVVIALLVILSAVPMYQMVKQEYIPSNVDEAEFEVDATAPEGTSLASMNEAAQAIEKEITSLKGVRLILTSVGGGFLSGVNSARWYVQIAPHEERLLSFTRLWNETLKGKPWNAFKNNYSQREVMQELRARLRKFKDLRCSVRNVSSVNMGGSRWEIDFVILGPDLEKLAAYSEELREKAPGMGIIDADTTLKLDKPELRVQIDRARAAALGIDTEAIASTLRIGVGGDTRVTQFYDASVNDSYDVQLRLTEPFRNTAEAISRLYVPSRDGGLIRLDNLVQIVPGQTATRIDRLDRQRQVALRASVAPGYALADRLEALKAAANDLNLEPGYTTRVAGRGRELERTFTEFLWAFLLSIIFMYMILASQFESTVHPFTILLSLPLCVPFALFALWITGNTLNLYSALGLLVLFGVVKKNSILQIDHMNKLMATGIDRVEAIIEANRDRFRPIMMTTLTLVVGMLPLALGTGPGAEERRTIAVVVIGGQSLSLFLTLIITPVVYSLFEDLRRKATNGKHSIKAVEPTPASEAAAA